MENPYCQVIERDLKTVPVPNYTQEEHGTWALLLEAQEKLCPQNACKEFIEGMKKISFPKDHIPRLVDISNTLESYTGWKLIRVEGLVHPKDFFSLLARKTFPCTDFIRKRSDLMYTPAPDMFHDLFGHTPLLTNHDFTEFFEYFGKVGAKALNTRAAEDPIHEELNRLYWFTVEFGLIDDGKGVRAYGSGSTSSPQELAFCLSDKCKRHPFNVDEIRKKTFDIWHLQEEVYVISSFQQLGKDFRNWTQKVGLAP